MENYARNSLKDLCEILNSASKCKGKFSYILKSNLKFLASFEKLIALIVEEQELSKK